ncbi:unnamed protein product [Cylicocyclus nassatus]|uniref:Uncharacterized protein n=1 Tax=Cylicocyclus nassatus TaxID=53992 RepID=A0AA36GLU9_CYLNA|nr:unnamed protein product [Cylicocyclus nassatus]
MTRKQYGNASNMFRDFITQVGTLSKLNRKLFKNEDAFFHDLPLTNNPTEVTARVYVSSTRMRIFNLTFLFLIISVILSAVDVAEGKKKPKRKPWEIQRQW